MEGDEISKDISLNNNIIEGNDKTINYDVNSDNVINAAVEFLFNDTAARNASINSTANISGNIKLLSPFNNNSFFGDLSPDQNTTLNHELQIPEYITLTSMIFCIIIMCLGLIGNIMVRINSHPKHAFCCYFTQYLTSKRVIKLDHS